MVSEILYPSYHKLALQLCMSSQYLLSLKVNMLRPGSTDVKGMHALCIADIQDMVNMCLCLQLLICPCRKICCCINVLQCLAVSASWADASKKTQTDTKSL